VADTSNKTPPETVDQAPAKTLDTEAMLHRILAAVQKDRRRGRLELALAIILSLATLSSTWCAYQANSWGSVGSSSQAAAETADRKAAEDTIVGLQLRTFDGLELVDYWTALRQKDTETSNAISVRMRPQLRAALKASLAAGVLTNPEVAGPFQRPEYVLTEEVDARRLRDDASKLHVKAVSAGLAGGHYVMLTLMFASVLFFGGITGTFTARGVRTGLACVALAVFVITISLLIGLPVCKG
jgi:hypothetical protein